MQKNQNDMRRVAPKKILCRQVVALNVLVSPVCKRPGSFFLVLQSKNECLSLLCHFRGRTHITGLGMCAAGFLQWPAMGCKRGGDDVYEDERDSVA